MIKFAERELELKKRVNEVPLKEHLLSVYRQTGKLPDKLANKPKLPYQVEHVWDWFNEIDSSRGSNGFSVLPLDYKELHAWSELMGTSPTPWEIKMLRRLDSLYRAFSNRQDNDN